MVGVEKDIRGRGVNILKTAPPPFSEVSISVDNKAKYKIRQEEWHGARLVVSLTFVRPHSEQKATQPTNNPLFE